MARASPAVLNAEVHEWLLRGTFFPHRFAYLGESATGPDALTEVGVREQHEFHGHARQHAARLLLHLLRAVPDQRPRPLALLRYHRVPPYDGPCPSVAKHY
jgi:hypothetical protein